MTLIKQLWLAIAAIMTLSFGISFLVSTWSAKNYLEDQLRLKNQDNATSLALSMSQIENDPVTIELLIAAQFDIGHYRGISLSSPTGSLLVQKLSDAPIDSVPAWFVEMIPLASPPGVALVQNGWHQVGTLTVVSHNRFAYQALWQGTLRLLAWFLAGIALCGIVGTLLLRRVLRPLDDIVAQAEAIGARRFLIVREPRTREFRSVVQAMNTLTLQVRDMLDAESARLEQLRRAAQTDPLTGLSSREHFMKQIRAVLEDDAAAPSGVLFILRLSDLAGLNSELGRESADTLLRRLADALRQACPDEACVIGRLNGADFGILVPGTETADELAQRIHARALLAVDDPSGTLQHDIMLGGAAYRRGDALPQLLSRADLALGRAAEAGGCAVDAGDERPEWKPVPSLLASWKTLIETAVSLRRVQFAIYPVLDGAGRLIHYEAPARMQVIQNGQWLPAQEFMPWASRLGLVGQIDEAVFDSALEWLETNAGSLCINVSLQTVCDPGLTARYAQALRQRPHLTRRIWIDIPEFVAHRHAAEFRAFCAALKPLGCRLGLEHAGSQIGHLGELYDVGLDYLKIDRTMIRDIDQSPGNQTFLRGLCAIAHTMGIMSIAEGVATQHEARTLHDLGFGGVTGPAITLD